MRVALESGHIDVVVEVGRELERRGHTLLGTLSSVDEADLYLGAGPEFRYIEYRNIPMKGFMLPIDRHDRLISLNHDLDWGPTEKCRTPAGWLMMSELKYKEYIDYAKRCALIGWPKTDVLFRSERKEMTENALEELGMKYDKTVLYAPTTFSFTKEKTATHPTNVVALLKQFKNKRMNLIIKEHIDWIRAYGWEGRREALRMAKGMDNVRWLDPRYPLIKALLVSDVLMTWRFCCVFKEFMLKGPVIELRDGTKLEEEQTKNKAYPDTDAFKVPDFYHGLSAHSDNVLPSIKRAIENPSEFKKERERMIERYFYKPDGHASERGADAIEKWSDEENWEERE